MIKSKFNALILLYIYFVLASIAIILINASYFFTVIFFTGVPSIFLAIALRKYIYKILIESFVWSLPASIIIDGLGHLNKAWFESSIFKFRLFNLIPLEGFIWGFMFVLFVILFYEYFFDKYRKLYFNKWSIKAAVILYIFTTFITIAFLINQNYTVKYFYLIVIILFTIYFLVFAAKSMHLVRKSLVCGLYLFPIFIMWEIDALIMQHWTFELGQHIAYFFLFNKYHLPIEEVLWFLVLVPGIVLTHELFADNNK